MMEDYYSGDTDIDEAAQGVCAGILVYLDTLVVDAPEDLDEVADMYEKTRGFDAVSDNEECRRAFKAGAEWAFGQFEPMGTFPVEDARGGYWPTEYFVRKK